MDSEFLEQAVPETFAREMLAHIGLAVYQLQSKLPIEMKGKLPTVKQLSEVVRAALPAKGGN
ncbi:MAG: hypothetical protein WC889_06680 [Myxococcota bacterium]